MTKNTPTLLDLPASRGARRVAAIFIEGASEAAVRLREGADELALHDFRTMLRRTRSALRLYSDALGTGAPRWQKRLAKVADVTSPGRDAEVLLAWAESVHKRLRPAQRPGALWLRKRLQKERDAGYAETRKQALKLFGSLEVPLREWLLAFPPERPGEEPFAKLAARKLRDAADELASRLLAIESVDDERPLHTARIRAKRLRYSLEPLRAELAEAVELVERLRALQDVLGGIRDRQLLMARAAAGLRGPGARKGRKAGLAALHRHAAREVAELFKGLQDTWLEDGLPALLSELDALAAKLEQDELPTEIERKYLLRALPPRAKTAERKELWQGWIPGTKLQERLRRVRKGKAETFLRTVKLGRGITRVEVEEETPRELFEKMWPLTEGRRVLKRRYLVPDGPLTWELDEFIDRELFLAEVELPSEDVKVALPDWLAPHVVREVTGEDEYVNVNLAR